MTGSSLSFANLDARVLAVHGRRLRAQRVGVDDDVEVAPGLVDLDVVRDRRAEDAQMHRAPGQVRDLAQDLAGRDGELREHVRQKRRARRAVDRGLNAPDGRARLEDGLDVLAEVEIVADVAGVAVHVATDRVEGRDHARGDATDGAVDLPLELGEPRDGRVKERGEGLAAIGLPHASQLERSDLRDLIVGSIAKKAHDALDELRADPDLTEGSCPPLESVEVGWRACAARDRVVRGHERALHLHHRRLGRVVLERCAPEHVVDAVEIPVERAAEPGLHDRAREQAEGARAGHVRGRCHFGPAFDVPEPGAKASRVKRALEERSLAVDEAPLDPPIRRLDPLEREAELGRARRSAAGSVDLAPGIPAGLEAVGAVPAVRVRDERPYGRARRGKHARSRRLVDTAAHRAGA